MVPEIRSEIERCLRAGPAGWTQCQAEISSASKWLVSAARGKRSVQLIMVDFCRKFSREKDLYRVACEAINILRSQAAGARDWKAADDPDISDAFPAMEVFVVMKDLEPSGWQSRWTEAGGRIVNGRAMAGRQDPVWQKFSAYGHPFPPFDWSGALAIMDIDRDEAIGTGDHFTAG